MSDPIWDPNLGYGMQNDQRNFVPLPFSTTVKVTPDGGPGGDGGDYGPRTPGTSTLGIQEAIKAQQTIDATAAPSMGKRILIANGVQYNGAVVISGGYIEVVGETWIPGQGTPAFTNQPYIRQIKVIADANINDMVNKAVQNQVSIRGLALAELDFAPPNGISLTDFGTEDLQFFTSATPGNRGLVFDNTSTGFAQYFRSKGRMSFIDANVSSGTPGDGTGQAVFWKGNGGSTQSAAHWIFDEIRYIQGYSAAGTTTGVFAAQNGSLIDGLQVGYLDVNFAVNPNAIILNLIGTGGVKNRVRALSLPYTRWEVHQAGCVFLQIDPNSGGVAFQGGIGDIHTNVSGGSVVADLFKVTNTGGDWQSGSATVGACGLLINRLFRANGTTSTDYTSNLDAGLNAIIASVV